MSSVVEIKDSAYWQGMIEDINIIKELYDPYAMVSLSNDGFIDFVCPRCLQDFGQQLYGDKQPSYETTDVTCVNCQLSFTLTFWWEYHLKGKGKPENTGGCITAHNFTSPELSEDQMEKIMLKRIDIDLQSQGSCFFSKSQDALFYISSRARKALAGWEEGVELYAAKALHACLKEKEPGKEVQALTFQGEPLPEPVTGTVVVRSGHTVFLLMARAEAVEDPSYVGQIIQRGWLYAAELSKNKRAMDAIDLLDDAKSKVLNEGKSNFLKGYT